jgi:transcriptional regulator with XRE-family HTH domain
MTRVAYNSSIEGGIIMENVMLRIGENIKALREQSGFTQSNLAKYLNVDQSLISKIEKNERSITSDMLDRLATLFGVTAESFYQETIPANQISFALRASEINEDDLETISAINRIALNSNFMTKLLGGGGIDR